MNSVETSAFLLPRGWKTVFEAFSPFPRGWKAVFEAFFQLRPWPKCSFCRFSFFGHGRNAVFFIFKLSAAAETLFLLFFTLRPRRKADFRRFLSVVPLRKAVFAVFY